MPTTFFTSIRRSTLVPQTRNTTGLDSTPRVRGVARATRGLLNDYVEQATSYQAPETDPPALLCTTCIDGNGIPRLLSDDIVSLHFSYAGQELFDNPDQEYTGYGANGFWYTNGKLDPTHVPFKASWAQEGEGDPTTNRSDLDRMPERVLTVATFAEVAMFDADTLNLWMRFTIDSVPPPGLGGLVGNPEINIADAKYVNGFLLIATNIGLRIADFKNDRGMLLLKDTAHLSIGGLSQRNDDSFLDGSVYLNDSFRLLHDECLSMDVGNYSTNLVSGGSSKASRTVAAVGHPDGITSLQIDNPSAALVVTAKHQAILTVTYIPPSKWLALDDLDFDDETPLITTTVPRTTWADLGAQSGDWIRFDILPDDLFLIDGVPKDDGQERISLRNQQIPLTAEGQGIQITRRITAILIDPTLRLFFGNGRGSIAQVRDPSWVFTDDYIFDGLLVNGGEISDVDRFHGGFTGIAKRGELILLSSGAGVFSVSEQDLRDREVATHLYSTEYWEHAGEGTRKVAAYPILQAFPGDTMCSDVTVDPETGSILVAVNDAGGSVVTEINPNTQRAFRYFDNVGIVRALTSFRNPGGPPDDEPREAP